MSALVIDLQQCVAQNAQATLYTCADSTPTLGTSTYTSSTSYLASYSSSVPQAHFPSGLQRKPLSQGHSLSSHSQRSY